MNFQHCGIIIIRVWALRQYFVKKFQHQNPGIQSGKSNHIIFPIPIAISTGILIAPNKTVQNISNLYIVLISRFDRPVPNCYLPRHKEKYTRIDFLMVDDIDLEGLAFGVRRIGQKIVLGLDGNGAVDVDAIFGTGVGKLVLDDCFDKKIFI